MMGIKKDEPDDDEDGDAPPELSCNQEDADIRDMKYKLEKLCSKYYISIYVIVLISLFLIKKDPNYLVVTFLNHSMETCYAFPQKTKLQRKDLSLRERNLIVRNITWVFDKVSRLD